jgi:hypothetical protein
LNWIAVASTNTLLVRVELTFKLRVMTALGKRTRAVEPAREPVVRYDRPFPKRRPLPEVEKRGVLPAPKVLCRRGKLPLLTKAKCRTCA